MYWNNALITDDIEITAPITLLLDIWVPHIKIVHFIVSPRRVASSHMTPASAGDLDYFETLQRNAVK